MKFFIIFAVLLTTSLNIFAQLVTNCQTQTTPLKYSYCIYKETDSSNPDILYYFHGKSLNEKTWGDSNYYPPLIQAEWKKMGIHAPTVVAISFGQVWLLVEKNKSTWSGLFEVVDSFLIPQIEQKLQFKGQRYLLGESMGGFNSAQIYLKSKMKFNKVALLCPAIVSVSPYSTKEEIEKYIERTQANPELVSMMQTVSRMFLSGPEDWERTSPLLLAEKNLNFQSPDLYISCGTRDEYGFFEGTKLFSEIASQKGVKVHWRPLYGTHCSVDAKSVADFLLSQKTPAF